MPMDASVFDKIKTYSDYAKADQDFQLRKALAAQQLQTGDTQNQINTLKLNNLQNGVLDPETRATLALNIAKLNEESKKNATEANNNAIGLAPPVNPATYTIDDILKMPPAQAAAVASPQVTQVNPLLASLAQTESAGNPNAISPKGAAGTYQIMPATARDPGFGVQPLQNWNGSDPRTAPQAEQQRFSNDYLNAQINRYHDKSLGLAAYNAGPGAVDNAIQGANGNSQNAIKSLPQETQDYVPKVLNGQSESAKKYTFDDLQNLHGDEFANAYKQLSPGAPVNEIKGIANGDIAFPSTYSMSKPGMQRLMTAVLQYDPTANEQRYKTKQNFMNGQESRTVRSLGVAVSHLDTLGQLADALGNGDVKAINSIENTWSNQTGTAAPNNFEAAKQIVMDEVVKAVVGAGGGQGDREAAQKTVGAANSPEQLKGAIGTYLDLMGGQINGLRSQFQQNIGQTADFDKLLSPQAASILSRAPQAGGSQTAANSPPAGATLYGTSGGKKVYKLPDNSFVMEQ